MRNDDTLNAASFQKSVSPGFEIITLNRKSCQEHFITYVPQDNEPAESLLQRVAEAVCRRKAQVVSQDVFGISAKELTSMYAINKALGQIDRPLTWIENRHSTNLSGTHIWAVSGTTVSLLELDGKVVGSAFEDDSAKYCRLSGLSPKDTSQLRKEQAAETFEQIDSVLQSNGMTFSNVLRTWFYNDDILSWYDDFNEIRNSVFHKKHVFRGLVPASTGVGGRNAVGTALVGGLLAIKPKTVGVHAYAVQSPLQHAATEYGSSFSRAVELDLLDHRRLYISGTASIKPDGRTAHIDDPQAQVKLTMEVVHAILESRGMDWTDVTRALAYFKYAKDAPIFEKFLMQNNLSRLPVIIVENDICRDELLFEVEIDAIRLR